MYLTFTPQMLPLLASALVGFALASYGLRYRRAAGALGFTLLALALVELALVEALTLSVAEPAHKIAVQQFGFVGQVVAPTAWLAFVLSYTRATRFPKWALAAMLSLEPVVLFALALTNSAHGLVWQSMAYDGQVGDGVLLVAGNSAAFIAVYAYGAGALGILILGWRLYRSRRLDWRQIGGLVGAVSVVVFGYSGFVADLLAGIDPGPYVLTGCGLALYWGFLHYRLLELGAIARDAAFESMTDGVIVLDPFGNVAEFNPIAAVVAGLPPERMLGRSLTELITPGQAGPIHDLLGMHAGTTQLTMNEGSAAERRYEVQVSRLSHGAQRLPAHLVVFRDVTERRLADAALRLSEERFRLQYRDSPIPSYSWRRLADDFVLEDHNDAAEALTSAHNRLGYMRGRTASDLFRTIPGLSDELARCWSERTKGQSERHVALPDGSGLDLALTFAFVPPDRVLLHAQDVTASKQARLALEHQAHYDTLTGLPNRALLYTRLSQGIERAQTAASQIALLVLDLDRFKEVNDTLGHSAGDVLLQEIALRLDAAVRGSRGDVETESPLAARLGGDEFAVVLENVDERAATRIANIIREALRAPVDLEGHLVSAEASVGIAICPDHAADAETLLRRADVAMYAAKAARIGVCVYSAEQDKHDPRRLEFAAELRTAIEDDQLTLHFQPQVDLHTGDIVGVEALVRWQHPRLGLVPPADFIGLAEQTGLIRSLSQWVLTRALEVAQRWHVRGLHLPVAVNLSAWDLHDPHLVERIGQLLTDRGLTPNLLRLEVTESSLILDAVRASATLSELRRMGVHSSVDDFGTGYSSLTQLKRLPVDELKIDRSFVRDMATDEEDRAIVHSTIGLAHSLGLRVVAEGVEDEVTAQLLADLACDWAQGYYFGKPLSEALLEPWLVRLVAVPFALAEPRPPENLAA